MILLPSNAHDTGIEYSQIIPTSMCCLALLLLSFFFTLIGERTWKQQGPLEIREKKDEEKMNCLLFNQNLELAPM